jgi:hypothetical protein
MNNDLVTPILPEPISVAILRSSPFLGATNDYHMSFDIVNAIPAGGTIRVVMPTDQVVLPTTGPKCYIDYSFSALACHVFFKPVGYMWVEIAVPCTGGCAAGTNV